MKRWQIGVGVVLIALLSGGIWLWRAIENQRPKGSDEDQIRSLIATGGRAANRKDPGTVNTLISDQWEGFGMRADQMRPMVARFLKESGRTRAYIPSNSIAIEVEPEGQKAKASFKLQFQGENPDTSVPAFDGLVQVGLTKEPVRYYWVFPGREWRVTSTTGFIPDFLMP